MDTRRVFGGRLKVTQLIIEKDLGTKYIKDILLLNAAR